MKRCFSLRTFATVFAIGLAGLILPQVAQAEKKKIGWNIDRAGDIMDATRFIGKKNQDRDIRKTLKGTGVTSFEAHNNRFKGKIDFLLATSSTRVYIAFRGTQSDVRNNKYLNYAGLPMKPGKGISGNVHAGWWAMATTAYGREIHEYLRRHARGKKILVTGSSQGGAIAAYTARLIQSDPAFKNHPLRLVTFGAPRYTDGSRFFRLGKDVDFWVFTVEMTKKNRCVDKKVYAWQEFVMHLRLTAPRNKRGDKVWHGRCLSSHTNYDAVHNLDHYITLSQKGNCNHVALRRDCKATKWPLLHAKN